MTNKFQKIYNKVPDEHKIKRFELYNLKTKDLQYLTKPDKGINDIQKILNNEQYTEESVINLITSGLILLKESSDFKSQY